MQLKTLTWNIGGGKLLAGGSDPNTSLSYTVDGMEDIISFIKTESPDIITIQEAHKNENYSQIERIATELEYPYFVHDITSDSHIDKTMRLGHGIISRYPIREHRKGFFRNPKVSAIWEDGSTAVSFDKGFTTCLLNIAGVDVAITALHLIPFRRFAIDVDSELATQILENVSSTIQNPHDRLIVQGDFNIDKPILREYLPRLFRDNLSEVPLMSPTTPKGRHYDHVLYKGIQCTEQKIISHVLTDHYPVVTTFTID